MSTLSDLLGAEAAPLTFTHAGKTYAVSPVTQERKTAVERMLKRAAYEDLYALREDMPADMYEDALAALQRDRSSYAYLGPVFWKTFGTAEGSAVMVAALLGVGEAEARTLLDERGPDVEALVREQVIASMPRAQAEAVRKKLAARGDAGAPAGRPQPAQQPAEPSPAGGAGGDVRPQ